MSRKAKGTLPVSHRLCLPPQEIVDLFKRVFINELYHGDEDILRSTIQEVKADLYNREYLLAFNTEPKRIAYCCRWSPSRAVAYASLFSYLEPVRKILQCEDSLPLEEQLASLNIQESQRTISEREVLCIGGGAGGELISVASIFVPTVDFGAKYSKVRPLKLKHLNVQVIDIADWSSVVQRLTEGISANWIFDHSTDLNITFRKGDVLKQDAAGLRLSKLNLITLLFTTNELFTEHKADSIRFFQSLNAHCSSNCHLLIVESAGSYSHITVGTKKFPIQFLIDTLLLGKRGEESSGRWELVDQNDSLWYRGDENVDYPLKLENMRFFYRLYRKK